MTGMRRGELCGLRWHDIDWSGATITVRRSVYVVAGDTGVKATTTDLKRTIPVTWPALVALERRHKRQQADAKALGLPHERNGYAWCRDPAGVTPLAPRNLTRNCETLCERVAREHGGDGLYRFHDLRHFAETEMLSAGIDPVTVGQMLGHTRPSTTTDIYGHPVAERRAEAAAVLGRSLSNP
jgi:integrase